MNESGFSFLRSFVRKLSGDLSDTFYAALIINPVMIDGLNLFVNRSRTIHL